MFGKTSSTSGSRRCSGWRRKAVPIAAALLAILAPAPAFAAADNPSGLPLPRFVTTRSDPINVRVGPGTKYGVAWVYVKAGTPVEIIQEFDTWRKIRDADGSEGWLHQNLLQGRRAGLVAPWKAADQQVPLRQAAADDAGVRAWLMPNLRVEIKECDGSWCKVVASATPVTGNPQNFDGYVQQDELWGVYKGEAFD